MNIEYQTRAQNQHGLRKVLRRLPAVIALGSMLAIQFSVPVQASPHSAWRRVDPLVGTWNVLVDIYVCDSGFPIATGSQSLALFNADGTRQETNATNPALRTPAYGHWTRVAKGQYTFELKYFRFNATGDHIGSTVIRHDLFLSDDGLSYYSMGPAEFLDTAGGVQGAACATATATRFE
jgi:hypothetical protein